MTPVLRQLWSRVSGGLGRRHGDAAGRVRTLERQLAALSDRVGALAERDAALTDLDRRLAGVAERVDRSAARDAALRSLEEQFAVVADRVTYSVVRDVGIVVYCGFPVYMFRHDLYFTAWRQELGEGHPWLNLTPADAREFVRRREAARAVRPPSEVYKSFWGALDVQKYNAIHWPLLACLHDAGLSPDFVDVGANIGDTAMSAAEALLAIGAGTHVHSFEPGPVFELARANVWMNRLADRITVHNVAASDEPGYLPMQILTRHSESGSVAGIGAHFPSLPLAETRFVRAAPMDEVLPADGRYYYLKIDAEGADFAVVRGAARLIEAGRVPIIHLEYVPRYTTARDVETMAALLRTHALFNLRGLDAAGQFDRFDLIPPDDLPRFRDAVASSPHGWCDVAFVSRDVLDTAPMRAFRGGFHARAG